MIKNIARFILIFSCGTMLSCTSLEPLPANPETLQKTVQPGDVVDVTRSNGQTVEFEVKKVDGVGLHGAVDEVPYKDMKDVSREKISWRKTGLIGAGVAAIAVLLANGSSKGGGGGW